MSELSSKPLELTPVGQRRQLHKATPFVAGAQAAVSSFFVLLIVGLSQASSWENRWTGLAIAIGLSIVGALIAMCIHYLMWQRFTYWFDEDGDFRVDSGVISLNRRRLQLSRMQAVEVTEPLLARIFSLAVVTVDVAGSSASKVKLSFLSKADAEALRWELLTRASGADPSSASVHQLDGNDVVDGEVIAEVDSTDLALSLALRSSTFFLIALACVIAVVTYFTEGLRGLTLTLVTGGIPGFVILLEFMNYYGFTIRRSPNGVRLKHGLLQTQHQTVPPGRIAAVDVVQPLLWRLKGWVRVKLTVAGVAGDSDGSGGTWDTVLIPVAKREEAMTLLTQLLSGTDVDAIELKPVIERAKFRAPFQWKYLGVGHDNLVFVARSGWITRHLTVVPHARTQSVRVEQGIYQRWLGLATMCVDVPPGPVNPVALYRTHHEALKLAQDQAQRARLARSNDISARWANP